eukprot:135902-Chlamydomonas_euryale.AAC.1
MSPNAERRPGIQWYKSNPVPPVCGSPACECVAALLASGSPACECVAALLASEAVSAKRRIRCASNRHGRRAATAAG